MPVQVPAPVYPVAESFLNMARENINGTAATGTYVTVPVAGFTPDPKITWLEDKGLRGAMTSIFDLQPGPFWTEAAIPASPLFGDTFGHILFNLFGDYTATGTAASPSTTLTANAAAGATSLTVASGSSFTAGMWIQVGTASTAEIVQVQAGAATSITLQTATPLRFAHLSAAAVTNTAAAYTHTFSVMNPASSTGSVSGQPPSHTLVHRNQVIGPASYYADLYTYGCFSQVKITGEASGLLTWEGNVTTWPQGAPAAPVTSNISTVRMIPSWRGTSTLASTSVNDISSWDITLTRVVEPVPTVDGAQAPFVLARGPLDGTFDLKYDPALDESALNNMINNTQPSLLWTVGNGGTGASLVQFSLSAALGGFKEAKLVADKTLFGYDVTGQLVGNSTNIGNSGGYGPVQIILTNAVPSY